MLPNTLTFAVPTFIYVSILLVVAGLYRQRARLDKWVPLLVVASFLISLLLRKSEHVLFYDEDIYIQIASNLSHMPKAQLTLLGGPKNVQSAAYYKEPAGFPVLLSLVFAIAGVHEIVAFTVARVLYGLAVAAVYLLGRETLKTRGQALAAAIAFAAAPACFVYSSSVGTDLPATLFVTLGVWGILCGNGMLAAAALAMAAGIRLEMIAVAIVMFMSDRISRNWKAVFAVLIFPEIVHLYWVSTIIPALAKAERVQAAFSFAYVPRNLWADLQYIFNPAVFPIGATILALAALCERPKREFPILAWIWLFSTVYLCFYAGSFSINPRYSIQITVPILLLAASWTPHKVVLGVMILTLAPLRIQPFETTPSGRVVAADHEVAVQFARTMGPDDLVIANEPEVFLNHGYSAMNTSLALQQPKSVLEQFASFHRVFYYADARTYVEGTEQWESNRGLQSLFEMRLIQTRNLDGGHCSLYELTQRSDFSSPTPRARDAPL